MTPKKHLSVASFLIVLLFTLSISGQTKGKFESKFTADQLEEAPVKLIPYPQLVSWNKKILETEQFTLKVDNEILFDEHLKSALNDILSESDIRLTENSKTNLLFQEGEAKTSEGYQLEVNKKGVRIIANTKAGFFYALQTLKQLIKKEGHAIHIPYCEIVDWPGHQIRGYMIDTGRNYHSMELLKKQLDYMAQYKMNTFHWHLTDRPAWRIESKKYPQLVYANNHRQTRNPGKYYSYDQIRELIAYAKERHIQIIPEIDMPGHSDSFVVAMGVKMESEKGMAILKDVLEEFFEEIPKKDCPIIHIGSDEVHIPNPDEFIKTMVDICTDNDREVIVWHPGLEAEDHVIRQTWVDKDIKKGNFREIDSYLNYVNGAEPMEQIQRIFFRPIGYGSENNILGGILCFWPDVNLLDENDAYKQNPVYSSLLTYAWATWTADMNQGNEDYFRVLPPKGTEALAYFSAFEDYLLNHKHRYFGSEPFPYFKQVDKKWNLYGPFEAEDYAAINSAITDKDQQGKAIPAIGNTLVFKDRWAKKGYFEQAKVGESVYAQTYIYSDQDREIGAMIGFETALRANKIYSGVPDLGTWDPNGGSIWVNDKFVDPPVWENAGWRSSKLIDWGNKFEQEIPWIDQDFYWTRTPTVISLNKGWNKVTAQIPYGYEYQNWMFTFIPVSMEGIYFDPNKKSIKTD